MKQRIDVLLVERGLADSRHKAQALLLAGQVFVEGRRADKPGRLVDDSAGIVVRSQPAFASRAGAKLQAALTRFSVPVAEQICADFGASTGGFTDCLLQNGAREVHAYDVGKGQLDWKLRSDPRVIVHDEFNVRYVTAGDLPAGLSVLTADLSFISLTKVLKPIRDALLARHSKGTEPFHLVLLVKPQFELGRGEVGKGGIVRSAEKQARAVGIVSAFAGAAGYRLIGDIPSPVAGSGGNQEFLLYLQLPGDLSSAL
jgi:23S rRNA (cytidine1920-2'-O)/16S rRNA (cytidine1409-2'-O)-methyltransferase